MSGDILDDFERSRKATYPDVAATLGRVVEDRGSGFCGDIVAVDAQSVTLRDRRGERRIFRFKPGGFLIDGRAVTLHRPAPAPNRPVALHAPGSKVSASGSIVDARRRPAAVAAASRIWVEGIHDAELIEHVWGDDLRDVGIVVEPMHGIDDLPGLVRQFEPGPQRRLGVLVDHLVPGSKEQRLAAAVAASPVAAYVLVTGHPFVDVWEGIRPSAVGLAAWPQVPRHLPWKEGLCAALGRATDADGVRGYWREIRGKVETFADLRPELVGAVEQLIDFVAPAGP